MHLLFPEAILLLTGVIVLIYDFIKVIPGRVRLLQISLAGILLSFFSLFLPAVMALNAGPAIFFSNTYWVDHFSIIFKGIFLLAGLLVILLNYDFFKAQITKNEGEFYFLLLTSLLGLMIAVSSPSLLMIFLGIEIVGQTSYLLVGWQKNIKRSGEAAIKYFLFGAVASAIFLYGVSIFYGSTGTFDLSRAIFSSPVNYLSVIFIILGIGFKIAMVPMQFWCPDVYEGAPTSITAYLSVAPKAMGLAVLMRVLMILRVDLTYFFAILSILTMSWGNIVALKQTNIKRLLAYSSIAQAGYIMMGLVSSRIGYGPMIFYIMVYTFANLGVFSAVIYLSSALESEEIDSYSGMAARSPFIAFAFTVFFLSLIGIPPLAGFMGKFLIFGAAIGANFLWLAVFGVVNSAISVYYYLNIVRIMYFKNGQESLIKVPLFLFLVILFTLGVTVLLGVFPNFIFNGI